MGDPVNTLSGTSHEHASDLAIATAGPSLAFERSYSSLLADTATYPVGILGPGWRHSFEDRLVVSGTGSETNTVIMETWQGNRLRFQDNTSTTDPVLLTPYPGVRATLLKSATGYTLTASNQRVEIFDTTGRLTQQIDPQGHVQTIAYGTNGLSTITDQTSGRTLTFAYTTVSSKPRLLSVKDSTNHGVTYSYDSNADLNDVATLSGVHTGYTYTLNGTRHNLIKVKDIVNTSNVNDPNNVVRTIYHYTAGTGGANDRVDTVTDRDQAQTSITYAANSTTMSRTGGGLPNDVVVDHYRSDNTFEYEEHNGDLVTYQTSGSSLASTTEVDGQGKATLIDRDGAGMPTQVSATVLGPVNADGSPRATVGLTATWTYRDDHRIAAMIDTQGITTTYSYDAAGNVTGTERRSADGMQILNETAGYDSNNRIVDQWDSANVRTHYTYTPAGQVETVTVGYNTNPNRAIVTKYAYDTLGRVTDVTEGYGSGLDRITHTVYNVDSTIQSVTQNFKNGSYSSSAPDEDLITSYGYDKFGRQVTITDPLGHVQATHYDAYGRITWTVANLIEPSGTSLTDSTTGQPNLAAFIVSTPDQNIATSYTYDTLGRVSLVTQNGILDGTFNASTKSFSNAISRVTKTNYDSQNRPIETIFNYTGAAVDVASDHDVRALTSYDGNNNPTWTRDTLGRWTKYVYDELGRQIRTVRNYENGSPTSVGSGHASWATTTDNDIITETLYDAQGRVEATIRNKEADSDYNELPYDEDHPHLNLFDDLSYDSLGRINGTLNNVRSITIDGTDGNLATAMSYNPLTGQVQGQQDTFGRWTALQYDVLGRVATHVRNCHTDQSESVPTGCGTLTQSAGQTNAYDWNVPATTTYDALGQVIETSDAVAQVTHLTLDGMGRTKEVITHYVANATPTSDTNVKTTHVYDALGRVVNVTDATGTSSTTYAYDGQGRINQTTDPMSRVTFHSSDQTGERWSKTPDGRYTVTLVDGLGRPTKRIVNYTGTGTVVPGTTPNDQNQTTTTVFDAGGRAIQVTDATGHVTQNRYDLRDQLLTVVANAATTCTNPPCNVTTQYTYDLDGNRVSVTDPLGSTQEWVYDEVHRIKLAIDGSSDGTGAVTEYVYDPGDRMTQRVDPRGPDWDTHYAYSDLDQLIGITATDSEHLTPISMTYDAQGRRTGLTDGTGTTSFTPDALGRLKALNAPVTGSVSYGYNARGDRTNLTYPGGTSIDYTYKPDGQLNQVLQSATPLATYGYDTAGRLNLLQRANGATTSYGYDGADQLNDILTSVGSDTIDHFHYTLDRLGLRTRVDETQADAGSSTPSPTITGTPPTATRTGTQPTATRTLTPSQTNTPSRTPTGPTSTASRTATSTATSMATATPTAGSSTLVKAITFEGGSLTDAATGVDAVVAGSSPVGSVALDTTTLIKGQYNAKFVGAGNRYLQENITAASTLYLSFYLRVDAIPSTSTQIMGFYAGSTRLGNIQLTSAGKLRLRNNSTTVGSDSTTVLTVGTIYRIGIRQTSGSGIGVLEAFVATGDGSFSTIASNSAQTIASSIDNLRLGGIVSDPVSIALDDSILDTGSMPGPSGTGATATPTNTVAPSATPTLTPSPTATSAGPSATSTRTLTPSKTPTVPTNTPSLTPSKTPSATATAAGPTNTATATATVPTLTPTSGSSTRIKTITFEGGSLTDATTGVDTVVGTVALDSSASMNGQYSAKVVNATSSYLREDFTATNTLYMAFYLRVDAVPSSSVAIATIYNGSTRLGNIQLTSGGALRLRNDATTIGSDSAQLTVGIVYRVGIRQTLGSSNGVLQAFVVQGDNAFGTAFASDLGQTISAQANRVQLGATVSNVNVSVGIDTIALDTGSMPGPSGSTGLAAQYSAFSLRPLTLDVTTPTTTLTTTTPLDLAGNARLFLPLVRHDSSAPVLSEPVHLANLVTNTRTITYAYDGLLRLTSSGEAPGNIYAYTYDDAGNRLQTRLNGTLTHDLSYNEANQVIADNGNAWTYDDAGNLTSYSPSDTVSYDALNRMIGTSFESVQASYTYNGDDVLVQQQSGGTTTNYTQDLAAPLNQILSDGTQTYIYGAERLAAQTGSTTTWYASDALSSVRHTLDSAGTLSAPLRYDPLGMPLDGATPTFGFTGELTDASGYLYLRARRYDPGVGFFTSRDSMMGQADQPYSFNPYQYAYSAPTMWMDPTGQSAQGNQFIKPCPSGTHRVMLILCVPNGPGDSDDPGADDGSGTAGAGGVITSPPIPVFVPSTEYVPAPVEFVPAPNPGPWWLPWLGRTCAMLTVLSLGGDGLQPEYQNPSQPTTYPLPQSTTLQPTALIPTATPDKLNRGKLQIQGKDIQGHPEAVGDTLSWSWARSSPITVSEGLQQLENLWSKLNKNQQRRRMTAYRRAQRYIESGPPSGHVYPGRSFSYNREQDGVWDARVDVAIDQGVAFEK